MYPCADPLFYLHHSMLDKIWWQWQNANRTQRLREIEGPLGGEAGQQSATLNFEIHLGHLHRNITIDEVMDTRGHYLCYIYE